MPYEKEKKQKKSSKNSYSLLFKTFAGSFVTLTVKNIKAIGSRSGKISNVMIAGYLLDEDADFYFIGKEDASVFAAVKKDEVAAIMLADDVDDLMSMIDVPPGSEVQ